MTCEVGVDLKLELESLNQRIIFCYLDLFISSVAINIPLESCQNQVLCEPLSYAIK